MSKREKRRQALIGQQIDGNRFMYDVYGESDPRAMPRFRFHGAVNLDYGTAVKADASNQNYTVFPRYWYIDATFSCARCGNEFCFSASEQRHWYEDRGFYIDSLPRHCLACRQELRRLKSRRQEYDRDIAAALSSGDAALKRQLVEVIDELCECGADLPDKILENRCILAKQIARESSQTEE
jgi:hypothetical protein